MIDEFIAASLNPGFAIYCGIVAVFGLAMWSAAQREVAPDWHGIKQAKCKAETRHKIKYAPQASLALTEIFPRPPGLYSEQVCRCELRQRVRWIGFTSSKRAQDFQRTGK